MPPKAIPKQQKIDSKLVSVLKEVLHQYVLLCKQFDTTVCKTIKEPLLECIKNEIPMTIFIVDPRDRTKMVYMSDIEFAAWLTEDTYTAQKKTRKRRNVTEKPLVRILPLIEAIRSSKYVHIQQLCVYDVLIDHSDMMCLAGMLSKGSYLVESIELINCFMDYKGFEILMPSLNFTQTLTRLVFDYNEFGDQGCHVICKGLSNSTRITVLSMCYCGLHKESGIWLGELLCTTPIRELYIDGNKLESEGIMVMLYELSEAAQLEKKALAELRIEHKESKVLRFETKQNEVDEEPNDSENLNTNLNAQVRKERRKRNKKNFPPSGPQATVLRLAQNGIDQNENSKQFSSARLMQLVKRIISGSKDIKEIDLNNNDIGDCGARMIFEGLLDRYDAGLPKMYVRIGHVINQDTYDIIQNLAPKPRQTLG